MASPDLRVRVASCVSATVVQAVFQLRERRGSSIMAIEKWIAGNLPGELSVPPGAVCLVVGDEHMLVFVCRHV